MLDTKAIRSQFPLLQEGLSYLDSAATAQKPQSVLDAMTAYYENSNANAHRGMYPLADQSTTILEDARSTVQQFLGAKHADEIIFTKSATESINLVARTWGEELQPGDAIVLSLLEHHANIVPWMQLAERKNGEISWIPLTDDGQIDLDAYDTLLTKKPRIIAITGQSNVTGVRPPLEEMISKAHAVGAHVLVDASQLVTHHAVDVTSLDCDFLVFSGHKLYGPTGIGVLYAKRELLASMPTFLGGGGMIESVTQEGFTSTAAPMKFEAGSPPVAEAAGLAAAIQWLMQFDWKDIEEHENHLIDHAYQVLSTVPDIQFLPHYQLSTINYQLSGCLSFTLPDIHAHDLTALLGEKGICLRAGHHCAEPLHKHLDVGASTRLSVALYNTLEEIDRLPDAIADARAALEV